MSFAVLIYRLGRGMADTWGWYCARCLHVMKLEGWAVLDSKEPPHALGCDGQECAKTRTKAPALETRAA